MIKMMDREGIISKKFKKELHLFYSSAGFVMPGSICLPFISIIFFFTRDVY